MSYPMPGNKYLIKAREGDRTRVSERDERDRVEVEEEEECG